jgi:hypothetical protein
VQLQGAKDRFEKQGIKLAAISYDSVDILKSFADRRTITYPLLADPESKIISSYRVLNPEAKGMQKGMALPGYFFIGTDGVIHEKYFETKYTDRYTANNLIGKLFPELGEEVGEKIDAPHLNVALRQSDRVVVPGSRITLMAEVELPHGVHVYAPGVSGYKPIQLEIQPLAEIELASPEYPKSKTLYLPVIKERVPVFEGNFRIAEDATISATPDVVRSLGAEGKPLTVTGELRYQACDAKTCYLPASIPLHWQLQVTPLDFQRAPEAVRHQ